MKVNGFAVFITKANNDVLYAINDYMFDRHIGKDNEKALQKANEAVYKAIQTRNMFMYLQDRCELEN
jgi:hypothetical protein